MVFQNTVQPSKGKRAQRRRQRNEYDEIKPIGAGAQGECVLLRRRHDGQHFVRKADNNTRSSEGTPLEVQILHGILGRHKQIIDLAEWDISPTGSLVTYYDFCAGGDMRSCIPKRGEGQQESFAWWILNQFADAVAYLHRGYTRNLVEEPSCWRAIHGDIKPDNILLYIPRNSDNEFPEIKLADFGMSTPLPAPYWSGSAGYTSPEIYDTGVTKATDVWGLGANNPHIDSRKTYLAAQSST